MGERIDIQMIMYHTDIFIYGLNKKGLYFYICTEKDKYDSESENIVNRRKDPEKIAQKLKSLISE